METIAEAIIAIIVAVAIAITVVVVVICSHPRSPRVDIAIVTVIVIVIVVAIVAVGVGMEEEEEVGALIFPTACLPLLLDLTLIPIMAMAMMAEERHTLTHIHTGGLRVECMTVPVCEKFFLPSKVTIVAAITITIPTTTTTTKTCCLHCSSNKDCDTPFK